MTSKYTKFTKNKFEKPFIKRACFFCEIDSMDYKNVGLLKKYISGRGKIESAARTGTCAKCQRNLTVAIKRARHMAILPFSSEHVFNTKVVVYKQEKLEKRKQEITDDSKNNKDKLVDAVKNDSEDQNEDNQDKPSGAVSGSKVEQSK